MSEWQTMTLGEITDWFSGGTPSKQNESFWIGEIPWISARTLKGTRVSDSELKISKEGLEDGSRLAAIGDLLLLVRGSGLFNAIPISIVESPVAFNQDIKAIRIKKKFDHISPWFLLYWFQANTRILYGIMEETGIGAGKFDLNLLKDLTIEIPPKRELEEITKTSKSIDDKIILLRQQNQDLEELAQTLFKRWFVEFEFPNENGEPYKSSGGLMVESELGEIPKGWRLSTIGENIETIGGGTPSTTEPTFWEDGEILWYSPTDLTKEKSMYSIGSAKKITELGLQKSSAKLFPAYSLLMTSRATVGELTINTHAASTNQGFITLIPNENLSIYFLYDWLKSKLKTVHNLASGSTFPEISKTDFRNIEVLLPTKVVHTEFDNIIKPIFKLIENNTKEIQTLTQLRDTLLPKLMSGELRVKM